MAPKPLLWTSAVKHLELPAPLQGLFHTVTLDDQLIIWILDFSTTKNTERPGLQQPVVLLMASTGIPECCVLSQLLFILYHNESRAPEHNCPLLKMTDEADLLSFLEHPAPWTSSLCSVVPKLLAGAESQQDQGDGGDQRELAPAVSPAPVCY